MTSDTTKKKLWGPALNGRLRRRFWLFFIGPVLLGLALIFAPLLVELTSSSGRAGGGRPELAPVYVELSEPRRGTMRQVGRYYGSLESPSQFTVSTQVSGVLEELAVNLGDKIINGQIIARLDSRAYELQVEKARQNVLIKEAQLREAQANFDLAQSDLNRQMSLSLKRIVPQSDLEAYQNKFFQAQAKLAVAETELENARTALKDAELTLSYTKVEARWAGGGNRYISQRFIEAGELVSANTQVVTVVELDTLTAAIEVIEKDYPKIFPGQEADVYVDAWPGQRFKGVISRIAPVLSPATRQARVEVTVDNPELRLKPGMFTRVELVFERRENALAVPLAALTRRLDGFAIFEADPATQTVRRIPVREGFTEDGFVELLETDLKGPVVTLGHHLLEDGMSYLLPGQPSRPPETSRTALGWWSRLRQKVFPKEGSSPARAGVSSNSGETAGPARNETGGAQSAAVGAAARPGAPR